MCARVSSRPRVATAGTSRLATNESASITEIALAASRCARWMVIVSVSTSRWTIYLTLATFTTASTFKPATRRGVVRRLEKQAVCLRPALSARLG